jgi:putative hydrolase of the HAD superfamily
MNPLYDIIAFDADDTLWHNEVLYSATEAKFKELLEKYQPAKIVEGKLHQVEIRNLQYFGYGIKGFTFSMIETAIELTEGQIRGADIQRIIDYAREMLDADVQLFDHVEGTLAYLSQSYRLMLVTKGDLRDQEMKITRSGVGDYFSQVEVLSDKTRESYTRLLAKYDLQPARFMMVGNSLKSDILPVVELGGCAVYIPYENTWAHENDTATRGGYFELEHIGLLPEFIDEQRKKRTV